MIERNIKNSQFYKDSMNNYANMTDNYGKAALHYAVWANNIGAVNVLIANGASVFLRDYK